MIVNKSKRKIIKDLKKMFHESLVELDKRKEAVEEQKKYIRAMRQEVHSMRYRIPESEIDEITEELRKRMFV